MCIFKIIYKSALKIPKVDELDTFLFVSPHPDDSDVSCGALISKLVNNGKTVYILNATDGCFGSKKYEKETLVKTRQQEDINAKKVYGLNKDNLIFLPFSDGAKYEEMNLANEIAKIIVKLKPDAVFTTDFHTLTECHPDHILVGRATAYAMTIASNIGMMTELGASDTHEIKAICFYNTDKPNRFYKVSKADFNRQIEAISCHKSQFSEKDIADFKLFFKIRMIKNGLKKGCRFADGYRVLTPFLAHCVPEGKDV